MTPAADPVASAPTLPEMFRRRVAATPQAPAYREYDKAQQRWRALSWAEAGERVARWRDALAALRLPAGSRVALLLPNGLDAMCLDQATLALGLVPVPLHALDNPGSIAYVLGDCQASLLVLHQRSQWAAITGTGVDLPALRSVVVTGDWPCAEEPRSDLPAGSIPVQPLAMWLTGAVSAADLPGPAPGDLAAIVYTSGTTGKPKGVMLSHANVVANVQAVLHRVQPRLEDRFLSFLPLSHTFERTAGYYLPIAVGACVAYARSVSTIGEDLLSQQPTVLISVPRIYERAYSAIQSLAEGQGLKAWLLRRTLATGWRRFRAAQGLAADADGRPGPLDALLWPLLQRVVAAKALARFGGRVRVAVSGGAALPPAVARCFLGLGLPLLNGYGMTETSPVVGANGLDDNDPASIGRALPGVEVRIGELRELQVRGPSVMQGYWRRPEDTAAVMMEGGWLRTGDQAEIIDGRLYIRGRIKEIIVTSTGEKIAPADLEQALCADPLFAQSFVVGEHQPFIGAVVVMPPTEWERLASGLGLDPKDPASLNSPAAREAALARIARLCQDFPRYAVPRAVLLTLTPWTTENTLLTPTLKLKRLNLQAHFATELAAMYAKH